MQLDLPKQDKDGNSYVSYSQLSLFKKDKQEYFERYIVGKPFEGNEWTDFGSKVGEALENDNFEGFSADETGILKKVTRLDQFEKPTKLKYEGFYVMGFIDSMKEDFTRIIDYKTGGKKKEFQYSEEDYSQLALYALSLRQETGITPTKASVEFIRRAGNPYRNTPLTVAIEEPIEIIVDISLERLKKVYRETYITTKQIEHFYKQNKQTK